MPEFKIPEEFCYPRELHTAANLIKQISQGDLDGPADDRFDWRSGFTVGYNPNSDMVYAYDEDMNTVNDSGELFISTGWSGQEGTLEEHIDAIKDDPDQYEFDDLEEIQSYEEYLNADQKKILESAISEKDNQ